MIVGTYVVSKNEKATDHVADTPNETDTLVILEGNKFKNVTWGEGTYKLSHSIFGTQINFYYNYEFGKAGFQTSIVRTLFKSYRISIDEDSNIYYYKIR